MASGGLKTGGGGERWKQGLATEAYDRNTWNFGWLKGKKKMLQWPQP